MEQVIEKRRELGGIGPELDECHSKVDRIVRDLDEVLYKTNRLIGKGDNFETDVEANKLVIKNEYVKKEIQRLNNEIYQRISDLRGIAWDVIKQTDETVFKIEHPVEVTQ